MFGSWVPGSIKIKYRGIHGALLDQAEKRMKQIAKRRIRRQYHHGNASNEDIGKAFSALSGSNNPYGYWWDRKWFHSLPANKGGAPNAITVVHVGHKIQIPNDWGVITYLRDKFESIGDIWVRNDHLYDDIEETNGVTVPGESREETKRETNIDDFNTVEYRDTSLILDGKEIDSEWFRGNFYHFRFRPSMRVKGGMDPKDMIDELSLKFVVELFADNDRVHFADVSLFVRYNIPENELFVSATMEILTW